MNSSDAEGWHRAMIRELQKTKEFDTFDLVRPPTDRNTLGSRWVFGRKHDGTLKARWVTQGFSQSSGLDYGETFSPVCRMGSVRLILALSNEKDLPVYHMDATNAFLQSPIGPSEDYVKQPSGFIQNDSKTGEEYVCKLKRSLYGP
ncbi:unnamed protein product [Discosporangium mesarthrocarpum]